MNYENQLRKLQELELDIAIEIKRVCEKNNIKYFLMYGSLLGAVRHGGFIPWDDDMDFGMLREDYDKFIKACEIDLDKEKFFLQTWDTDFLYPFPWAKIQLKGTRFVDDFAPENPNNGIAVDIFPFDSVPASDHAKKAQNLRCSFCTKILFIKKAYGKDMEYDSMKKKVFYMALRVLSKMSTYDAVKRYYYKHEIKYNCETTEYLASASLNYSLIKTEWTTHLDQIKFESTEFMAFQKKEEFLSYFYGDYMTPPPMEKRTGHNCISLDFGPYE